MCSEHPIQIDVLRRVAFRYVVYINANQLFDIFEDDLREIMWHRDLRCRNIQGSLNFLVVLAAVLQELLDRDLQLVGLIPGFCSYKSI